MNYTYIFGIFMAMLLLVVFFTPLYKKSYFGSGPEIFSADNSVNITNINLEPVYQKTLIQ